VIKPKGIATDCSLIASSRSSLPLNESSAIGLDKASRAHQVSIFGLLRPLTPIREPSNEMIADKRDDENPITTPVFPQ
jgi:hypothetical protein